MISMVIFCVFSSLLILSSQIDSANAQNLRLARGSLTSTSYSSGRLEVYINGQWGTVCDDGWSSTNSRIACRQLGFAGVASRSFGISSSVGFGSGTGQIWLDNVSCRGSETRLTSCPNGGIGVHDCSHSEDVAIYCSSRLTTTSGSLRLARGSLTSTSYTSGRLEVYINGQWGTVCDDAWSSTNSRIACRQLGFAGAVASRSFGTSRSVGFGSGTGLIWLDDVNCRGSETRLTSCPNRGIGVHDCSHSEDVAIYCSNSPGTVVSVPGSVRLARGTVSVSSFSSGRVEIFLNGEWGTVCNDLWGITESNVVCRQLGYAKASAYGTATFNRFSAGTGRIWLDNVDCSSSDSTLLSCNHNRIGEHNCDHSEDVAVFCSNPSGLSGASIAGISVGSIIGAMILTIALVVLYLYCTKPKKRTDQERPPPATATTVDPCSSATTAMTTTLTTEVKPTAYPTTGVDSYPSQPLPQPGAYPTQSTAYPAKGQEPPPPYSGQPMEMKPAAVFQPQQQPANPPPGYPEQTIPYPTQPPRPAYPSDPHPNQPIPNPTERNQGD